MGNLFTIQTAKATTNDRFIVKTAVNLHNSFTKEFNSQGKSQANNISPRTYLIKSCNCRKWLAETCYRVIFSIIGVSKEDRINNTFVLSNDEVMKKLINSELKKYMVVDEENMVKSSLPLDMFCNKALKLLYKMENKKNGVASICRWNRIDATYKIPLDEEKILELLDELRRTFTDDFFGIYKRKIIHIPLSISSEVVRGFIDDFIIRNKKFTVKYSSGWVLKFDDKEEKTRFIKSFNEGKLTNGEDAKIEIGSVVKICGINLEKLYWV